MATLKQFTAMIQDQAREIDSLRATNATLLEALERAMPWMLSITDEAIDGEGVRLEYTTDLEFCRAAIAAARGE